MEGDNFSDMSEYLSAAMEPSSDESSHSMEESEYLPENSDLQEETDYCSEESEDISEVISRSPEGRDPSIERSDVDEESWFTQFMDEVRQYSDTSASES